MKPCPTLERVPITVSADFEADRVMIHFGEQTYGLPVDDVKFLLFHILNALDQLRPIEPSGPLQ